MKLLPVWYWLAEAATVFLNGAISGLGSGTAVGGGAGIGTHLFPAKTGNLTPSQQMLVVVVGLVGTAFANGFKRFIVWHDANEFPNPFPKPSSVNPTKAQ